MGCGLPQSSCSCSSPRGRATPLGPADQDRRSRPWCVNHLQQLAHMHVPPHHFYSTLSRCRLFRTKGRRQHATPFGRYCNGVRLCMCAPPAPIMSMAHVLPPSGGWPGDHTSQTRGPQSTWIHARAGGIRGLAAPLHPAPCSAVAPGGGAWVPAHHRRPNNVICIHTTAGVPPWAQLPPDEGARRRARGCAGSRVTFLEPQLKRRRCVLCLTSLQKAQQQKRYLDQGPTTPTLQSPPSYQARPARPHLHGHRPSAGRHPPNPTSHADEDVTAAPALDTRRDADPGQVRPGVPGLVGRRGGGSALWSQAPWIGSVGAHPQGPRVRVPIVSGRFARRRWALGSRERSVGAHGGSGPVGVGWCRRRWPPPCMVACEGGRWHVASWAEAATAGC